jgi:methylated-DNA-[protein]-cysteine S-methyltransferase
MGICAFVLPMPDRAGAEAEMLGRHPGAVADASGFKAVSEKADRYFDGWRTEFNEIVLDLSSGTESQRRVWGVIRRVAYGQVRTYHWIGLELGRPDASRAIGAAVGANPVPLLIPCHRIVGSDGSLTGFSACGGLDLKARMLELERVRVVGEGLKRRILAGDP